MAVVQNAAQESALLPHNLILEERSRLAITGVRRVVRCDENEVALETAKGRLTVGGEGLSVSELDLETGEVRIDGTVDRLEYAAPAAASAGGLLRRLVR